MKTTLIAGVDIGGTKTAIVLSRKPPEILKRIAFPTLPAEGPERALNLIITGLREMLALPQFQKSKLHSIGVSCGSPLDPIRGLIQSPPNLPTWNNVPITLSLGKEFGVPCFLENDANAGALAEHWFGAGRGINDMVFLTMGTGLGAGFILDGRLYRGASYLAGEIGHVRLWRNGLVAYGKVGSTESFASGAGMAKVAKRMLAAACRRGEKTSLCPHRKPTSPDAREIWKAAQHGDALAQRIVEVTGEKLGEVLAVLIDLLNPARIVIGGLAVRMRESLLRPARTVAQREALDATFRPCKIVPAKLGEEIGDIAAICVALDAERRPDSRSEKR